MTIKEIQEYFEKIFLERGFENQNPEQQMLLLTEEVGELAKAIRKEHSTLHLHKKELINIKEEIADVLIVLIALCNELSIDLFDALNEKEKINKNRKWNIK